MADMTRLDPVLRDPAISTRMIAANGLQFETEICEPEHAADAPLALCLHGFPEHAYSWRHQLPLLARLGYRAWAPNQRGYGRSSRPPRVADYAMPHLLADVAGLIDASGATSVTLLGHDWGAAVAWYFAIERIRPLDRLVIMNVPHPAVFARELRRWRQLRRSWYMFMFQLPGLPEQLIGRRGAIGIGDAIRNSAVDRARFPDAALAVYRANAAQPGALTAMINWYRAAFRSNLLMRRDHAMIETPTLLIWGEEDAFLGRDTTVGTERHVRDLTIRYLPGVSHWVQQEAPEAVNAMLAAFLAGRPVPQLAELGPVV